MDSFERALDWLAVHQPRLHVEIERRRDTLQDFMFLRNLSYDCTQVLSTQRWALAGEAGRFLDPFYSPGSDFIAYGNTLTCELIARDRAGQSIDAHVLVYEQVLRSFYDSTLEIYEDQYGLFGDPEVLPLKVLWDYSYYWGVAAQIFFHGRLADLRALARLRPALAQCQRLNGAVQAYLRAMSAHGGRANPRAMIDQASVPWFAELNRSLQDRLDDAAFHARLLDGAALLHRLASALLRRGDGMASPPDGTRLREALAAGAAFVTPETGPDDRDGDGASARASDALLDALTA
jgi:hypothetical protein